MKDYLVLRVSAFINISSFLLYIPCESYKGVIPFALKTKTKYRTMAKCKIAHVSTFPNHTKHPFAFPLLSKTSADSDQTSSLVVLQGCPHWKIWPSEIMGKTSCWGKSLSLYMWSQQGSKVYSGFLKTMELCWPHLYCMIFGSL